jgi:hypothetical protein
MSLYQMWFVQVWVRVPAEEEPGGPKKWAPRGERFKFPHDLDRRFPHAEILEFAAKVREVPAGAPDSESFVLKQEKGFASAQIRGGSWGVQAHKCQAPPLPWAVY